jgi:hypothetical protein
VHRALEPELRQPLGLAGAGAEPGSPEQALGLLLAEGTTVDGRHLTFSIGGKAPNPLSLGQFAAEAPTGRRRLEAAWALPGRPC